MILSRTLYLVCIPNCACLVELDAEIYGLKLRCWRRKYVRKMKERTRMFE